MGWGGAWLSVLAARAALAGPPGLGRLPGRALPYDLPVPFEELGDQLVIDGDTGGLDHIKVRPLPAEEGPFSWAVGPAPAPAEAGHSPAASSWEPWPPAAAAPGGSAGALPAGHPGPAPAPPAPAPEEPQAATTEKPAEKPTDWLTTEQPDLATIAQQYIPWFAMCKQREGWPPLPLELENSWVERGEDNVQNELVRYPFRAVYHEDKAKKAAARGNDHYWHTSRGPLNGQGGRSPHTAPVAAPEYLAWTYRHPKHMWCTINSGVCIDDEMNLYHISFDAMHKFDLTGRRLWETVMKPSAMVDCPCLYKGGLYGSLTTGEIFCVDIEDGSMIWLTKVSYAISQDNGWVNALEDQVVCAADARPESGCYRILGLSTLDGVQLWDFRPDTPVWNFGTGFPGDGTVLFQDWTGKAYRLSMKDGSLLWKAGGQEGTWTDGTATLGPENVFYAVTVCALKDQMFPGCGGLLTAYRVKDGLQLWQARTKEAPNVAPAIGRLEPGGPLCVVQATGAQCQLDCPTYIDVFDARDGTRLWTFCGPSLQNREPSVMGYQAADPQGAEIRVSCGIRSLSLPNSWGAASIGGDGTIYCGNQDGQFYSLRKSDKPGINAFRYNGNWHGVVSTGKGGKSAEVWAWDCYACFGGPAGPAIAPGVLVVASIDTMYVYLDPSITSKPLEKKKGGQ